MKKITGSFISLFLLIAFRSAVFCQADLIVVNAKIRTIDEKRPRAEAVAITGNKISAVGTNNEIRKFAGKNTITIDAGGKLVLPGFNDSHVHFLAAGKQFFSLNLRGAKTRGQIIEKIRDRVRYIPKGAWLLGSGWDSANWSADDLPLRQFVDAAAPFNPVFIYGENADAAFANSAALEKAGLLGGKKNISGGEIVRDETGKPTGILKGRATILVKLTVVNTDKYAAAEAASNYAAAYGVTSVQEVSADYEIELYRKLAADGRLKTRIYECAGLSDWKMLAGAGIKRASGDAFVRTGCLKSFAEGDAENEAYLFEYIAAADKAELQILIHAIGAAANETILNVFEKVIKTNGMRDRRFRIEHAHGSRAEDRPRFAKARVIASMQPALFFGGVFNGSEPYRALLDGNSSVAFGSDTMMIPINPLDGIYAAVMTDGKASDQSITVEEAVRAYTSGAAYAEFQEDAKGTITEGKLADLIILSDDIFAIKKESIPQTRVLTTIVDGKIVYQAK